MKKTSARRQTPAVSVDSYIDSVPRGQRKVLEGLRRAIKAAAPKAEEVISYQIPTYKHNGALVHFMTRTDYCSFVVASRAVVEEFQSELGDFDVSGTTIHFTPDHPLPASLVRKIVRSRIRENAANAKRK